VDAAAHTDPAEIKGLLVAAMTSAVRFYETIGAMQSAGVTSLVEVGPGRVLCGLVKRSLSDLPTASVGSDEEADALAASSATTEPDGEQAPTVAVIDARQGKKGNRVDESRV
jgi:[acyl-carrier-protein] S-malonyltransferase